jgi:hypothetical protein
MSNPIFILELNEFNDELLHQAVKALRLPNIEKVLTLKRSLYKTDDRYNSGYLESWVQWASIHTGIPAKQHKIKNSGEMSTHFQPIWEKLGNEGVSCAVWGAINAEVSNHEQVNCSVPDVWNGTNLAHPKSMNRFLTLGRYVATHLQRLSKVKAKFYSAALLFNMLREKQGPAALAAWETLRSGLKKNGYQPFVLMAYYEHCSVLQLLKIVKEKQSNVTFLCLNLLSHLEQHYWQKADDPISPELQYGLKHLDTMIGLIFDRLPDATFIMHNGLSQLNMSQDKDNYYYHHKNLYQFLIDMRIRFLDINENFAPFWRMEFTCTDHCEETYQTLKSARLENKTLFKVERSASDVQLFVRLNIVESIADEAKFELSGNEYVFSKYFEKSATVTGRRVPMGTIYSNIIEFPDHIFNHDFNRFLLNHLNPEQYPLPKREPILSFQLPDAIVEAT